jgi:AcrR family transcriptional regulator
MKSDVKRSQLNAPLRRRGRPPSAAARRAILDAARQMLSEGGPAAVTMEGLAARAGVGKPTIYRQWPDRHAVAMAALMEDGPAERGPAARSPIGELRRQLHALAERFSSPSGRHVAAMIAAADPDSELSKAFRHHVIMARRADGAALLRKAIRSGEVARRLNVDVAVDVLYGAVFFRLLMGHAPLDPAFVDAALAHVLHGFSRARSAAGKPRL